jgi:hypothetical protein
MNKKLMILFAVLGLMILPLSVQLHAGWNGHGSGNGGHGNHGGNGNGGNGNGGNGNSGNGNGGVCNPIYNLLDGTPFSFDGKVVSSDTYGNELVVSTNNGNITVTGLGPNWYWFNLNMTKPVVGDSVSGNGYTIDYNGNNRNVLTDITVNGTLVPLRDSNGLPLWQGQGGGGGHWGNTPGNGGYGGYHYDILNGTPFNYSGDVISSYVFSHGIHGNGLELATASGNVTVSGLGPDFYWQSLGVDKPVVGDSVTANGYTVEFNGNVVNVLMSIVLQDGTLVQLRDEETGAPLWRQRS